MYIALFHPPKGKTIIERTYEPVPKMILGNSCHARKMAHGNLLESSVLKRHESRKKPVHTVEERQPLCETCTHHFQRTSRVGGGVPISDMQQIVPLNRT